MYHCNACGNAHNECECNDDIDECHETSRSTKMFADDDLDGLILLSAQPRTELEALGL